MTQVARNLTDGVDGFPIDKRYLLHDRDPLLTPGESAVLPANVNAPVERRERLGGLLNFYYRRAA